MAGLPYPSNDARRAFCCLGEAVQFSLQRECPLLAQSGHSSELNQCPLLGVKQTLVGGAAMSAFDPKRTFGG
jgi:hypothetical protein